MNPVFDHTFLEQYLAGKMSPVELEAFEKRLATEPVLKAELEAMKRMRGIESKTSDVKKEVEVKVVKKQASLLPWVIVALVVFVALMYAFFYFK